MQLNKMMMDAAGSGRFYHLEPEQHMNMVQGSTEQREFPTTIHLQFSDGFINNLEALEISKLFDAYGDFFLYKDSLTSIYLEFFFVDPQMVPSKKVEDLIPNLLQRQDLQIVEATHHRAAPKFKAHSNFDCK